MKSAVATTYELDDALEAARQLADSIGERLGMSENAVGVLLCDADMDGAVVTEELKKLLGIEVAGMTTLATLDNDGYHGMAAVLTVMTADDCVFLAAASEPLSGSGYEREITGSYDRTVPDNDAYGDKPGVIFVFCPNGMPFSGDRYPELLSKAACGAPVIGGVASDDYDYKRARVFLSGSEYKDSMVAVSIWGRIKPAFSIRHVTSRFAERIRRVTDADGNIVRKVGDETFVQYLESFGLKTDVPDPLLAFTSYPMMLTHEDDDEVPTMRHISGLDIETGFGTFFGDVQVGTMANICLVNKNDLVTACRDSMSALLEEADKQPDYEYSTIFCISCCGRAIILGADPEAEGRVLSRMLPEKLALTGAYCMGEISPSHYKGGKAINRFHNCSITFCMI